MKKAHPETLLAELKQKHCDFGTSLRLVRQAQGISIRKVAGEVNKTPTYISDIERGNNKPPQKDLLQKLMAAVRLSDDEMQIQEYLFDLAAMQRGEVSEDIMDYIMDHEELRSVIRLAQKKNEGGDFWENCSKKLRSG